MELEPYLAVLSYYAECVAIKEAVVKLHDVWMIHLKWKRV